MNTTKSAKIFNLATSLNEYNDEVSQNVYNRLKFHNNLFDQETPEKTHITNFDKNRTYDYVGVKQLRTYYERSRRVSKDKRRDTMPMSLGLSRHSVRSNKEDQLYNNWQIIEKVEKKIDHNLTSYDQNTITLDLTLRENANPPSFSLNNSKRIDNKLNQSASIIKMKNRYRTYKQNWEKQQKKTQFCKGFPSLLRLATQSRSISRTKQLNQQKFKKQNINQRMWSTVLRQQKQLKCIYDKQLPKYRENESKLSINGKNKLALQKQWISNKGDQGYRFQLLKKQLYKQQ